MVLQALVLAGALAVADGVPAMPEPGEEQEQMLRRLMVREPYSGIVRDGLGGMRMNPLPFTKRLPAGALDIDAWEGAGYEKDIVVGEPDAEPLGRVAVRAGICASDERPCAFSFVYLFSAQRSYTSKPDEVGIRYVLMKGGTRLAEGVIWGTEQQPYHYLREGTTWRRVRAPDELARMNWTAQLFHDVHRADLKVLESAGRISLTH